MNDTGTCVLVDGVIVAWFADFSEEAEQWCTENYFGRWLAWRAKPPEMIPITPEELATAKHIAAELAAKFRDLPQAD
jgi:hypothetical protein